MITLNLTERSNNNKNKKYVYSAFGFCAGNYINIRVNILILYFDKKQIKENNR